MFHHLFFWLGELLPGDRVLPRLSTGVTHPYRARMLSLNFVHAVVWGFVKPVSALRPLPGPLTSWETRSRFPASLRSSPLPPCSGPFVRAPLRFFRSAADG